MDIIHALFRAGLIRTWYRDQKAGWILRSGKWSPFYVQLRPLVSKPDLLEAIGKSLARLIKAECPYVTRLLGVAMAGIPIAVVTSISSGIPAAYTRKFTSEAQITSGNYGEHSLIEGDLCDGDAVALVDDVVTRFDSKLEAIHQLGNEADRSKISVSCRDICVVVDRHQGDSEWMIRNGIRIHSLVRLTPEHIESLKPFLEEPEYVIISDYLVDPDKYQDAQVQARLSGISKALH
jgi:orotate phosphoribosyltransferase